MSEQKKYNQFPKNSVAAALYRFQLIGKFGSEEAADIFIAEEARQAALDDAAALRTSREQARKQAPSAVIKTRRIPAHRAQEQSILDALRNHGLDPMALPKRESGRSWQAGRDIQRELGYTADVWKKAWIRLQIGGEIKDA